MVHVGRDDVEDEPSRPVALRGVSIVLKLWEGVCDTVTIRRLACDESMAV